MTIRRIGLVAAVAFIALPVAADAQVRGTVYLKTVRVTATPRPPGANWWDPNPLAFVGSLITKTSASLYPDIEICVGSRAACRLVCINAQLAADDPKLRPSCGLQLADGVRVAELVEVNGQPQWQPRDIEFEVNDIGEDGNTLNRRTIGRLAFYAGADPPILQPDRCSESEPCTRTIEMEGGPLSMAFTTVFAGVVGTLPRPSLPGVPPRGETSGSTQPPRSTSPRTSPEPEGRLARLWNTATDWLDSWWNPPSPWKPFVQGAPNECCVHPGDLAQGWYNDCFLLSALAAVATASPGSIKNLITSNNDGTYIVRLPGVRPVIVGSTPHKAGAIKKTYTQLAMVWDTWRKTDRLIWPPTLQLYEHSLPADGGVEVWPLLFERAYAKAVMKPTEDLDEDDLHEVFIKGGDSSAAMGALTGARNQAILLAPNGTTGLGGAAFESVYSGVVTTETELGAELNRLLASNRGNTKVAITVGSIGPCVGDGRPEIVNGFPQEDAYRCFTPGSNARFASGGLVPNHAYYFKRFDGKSLLLGNPFGGSEVPISTRDFLANFRAIYYVVFQGPSTPADCDCSVKS